MAICIAGMPRSGTSMVTGLLQKTGVYLGEDLDFLPAKKGENGNGFWEHFGFYALNERLLLHLGAGWDMPELPGGWASRSDLEPFREDALQLVKRMRTAMNGNPAWGWKDPRNSLTIQFWKSVLPDLRVVVCVRNPLEVAASLRQRNNFSVAASGRLWLRYYRNILDFVPPQNRVVTLYENYFADPDAEIKRLASRLGIEMRAETASAARGSVRPEMHHQKATFEDLVASELDPQIIDLYRRLRDEAEGGAPVTEAVQETAAIPETATVSPAPAQPSQTDLLKSRFHSEIAQREEYIHKLSGENAELRQSQEEFKAQLKALKEEMLATRGAAHPFARNLSAMAERTITLHGIMSHKRSQFAFLQTYVEATLKETKPMWPRFIRCSNTINSIFRLFKRIRKQGKLFTLQRELNDLGFELLGTLTHMGAVTSGHRGGDFACLPGLERYAIEKIGIDVPNLMELLRVRLS